MNSSSPRSIDDYLQALRAALAGADPALIQDALYDAEEHLRAEAAANPGKSEAELLEHIARTYGAPDEVAAAYRDSEIRVTAALQPPVSRRVQPRNFLSRFFSVYSDPRAYGFVARILETLKDGRTWTTLIYFVMMLPLGVVYFVIAVTGLSLGVSFFGVPVVGIAQRLDLWLPWDRDDIGLIQFTPAWLDTPAGRVFCVGFGVVILTTLLHLARAVVSIHARTAKTLLVLQGR